MLRRATIPLPKSFRRLRLQAAPGPLAHSGRNGYWNCRLRADNSLEACAEGARLVEGQSRTKRFERSLRNESATFETFYEPFARRLAADLSREGSLLLIVFDSSSVGRGCAALPAWRERKTRQRAHRLEANRGPFKRGLDRGPRWGLSRSRRPVPHPRDFWD